MTSGEMNRCTFPTKPTEHTFKAGHQIGIIVGGNRRRHGLERHRPASTTCRSRSTRATSKVTLPIVGGYAALAAAGAFTDPTAPVGGTVPATLSLTLGAPATFGAFTPGVGRSTRRRRRPP